MCTLYWALLSTVARTILGDLQLERSRKVLITSPAYLQFFISTRAGSRGSEFTCPFRWRTETQREGMHPRYWFSHVTIPNVYFYLCFT